MTELAARLDPCVNWFKLLARTKGRVLWLFPALLLGAYLGSLSRSYPLADFVERHSERSAHAPLLAEANALGLGYEQVAAKPEAYVGKPVSWCVGSTDGRTGFVSSHQTWPIVWTAPSDALKTNIGAYGYCWNVLAVVEGAERGVVRLRPVEKF